jgi:hypothetical protein
VAEDDSDRINEIGEGPADPLQIAAGTLDLKDVTWSPIWDSESAYFYETSSVGLADGGDVQSTIPTIKGTFCINFIFFLYLFYGLFSF